MTNELRDAIQRAVDWLRANPKHHIVGDLAMTANGAICQPNNPEANCFCMLGRISKELDYEGWPQTFNEETEKVFNEQSCIYRVNDRQWPGRDLALCSTDDDEVYRGNPEVLDYVTNHYLNGDKA